MTQAEAKTHTDRVMAESRARFAALVAAREARPESEKAAERAAMADREERRQWAAIGHYD